jgi:hypothetical protein
MFDDEIIEIPCFQYNTKYDLSIHSENVALKGIFIRSIVQEARRDETM